MNMADTNQIEEQSQGNKPVEKDNDTRTILVFTLMGFFIIYYIILLFYHYSRRNLFPISERSFKLTFIDGLCSMIFVIIVLISSYITAQHNFLLAPNLTYCRIDILQLSSSDIDQIQQNTIIAFQFLNNFIKFFKVINYLLRTFRLSYVFYFNLKQMKRFDSIMKKSHTQKLNISQTELNISENYNLNQQQQNQNNSSNNQIYNINQATYASEQSNNITEHGQFNNHSQNNNNQRNSLLRRPLEASLAYSEMSLGNDTTSINIPQSRLSYVLKRENLLLLISFLASIILAIIFHFIPAASPFIFWNIYFSTTQRNTHIYENVVFMVMNFFLILCILLCLMAIKNIEDNYRIKHEIYFMLSVFVIFGNTMQFQCPEYDQETKLFIESQNLVFDLIPYRLLISAVLDFVAINIEILLPIVWSVKERPWFNQQIVQDDLSFFCIKYKNFQEYLFFQTRLKSSQSYSASSCLPEILNLFLEMKIQVSHEEKLQKVMTLFQKFPYLIQTFRIENINVDEIFIIEDEQVQDVKENIQITSLPYQLLYQKTLQILLRYQRMFLKTPQYEKLYKRYQILNQISLSLSEFKMTGDESN